MAIRGSEDVAIRALDGYNLHARTFHFHQEFLMPVFDLSKPTAEAQGQLNKFSVKADGREGRVLRHRG